MKIEDIQDVLEKYKILENRLTRIIKDTFDDHLSYITSIDMEDDGDLSVSYVYTCRGCSDGDFCTVPAKWLEDDFDYETDFKKATEEARKRAEAEEKRAKEEEKKLKERRERAKYERLKKKYGTVGD